MDPRQEKPRKQQREELKRTIGKKLRNYGKSYVNIKGKLVEWKKFQKVSCGCKRKCTKSITEDDKCEQFDLFHRVGDFDRKNEYPSGLVHQASVKQRRP